MGAAHSLPGERADRGLVFLGVNPSYRKGEQGPRIGDSFETWDGWARHYFTDTPQPWATLYRRYHLIGKAVYGPGFKLGEYAIVLECVRFRSAAGKGTKWRRSNAVWEKELPTTGQLLREIGPKVVVTVGKDPLWAMSRMADGPSPALTSPYRLEDYEFRPFAAELGGRAIKVVPSHHLTGVWGAAGPQIAKVASVVRSALGLS
ncbi:MAG: hypothetical protein ACRENX_02950 [Candidatus Dormibacteria bacterium]